MKWDSVRRAVGAWIAGAKTTERGSIVTNAPRYPEASNHNVQREGYGKNEVAFAGVNEIASSAPEAVLRIYDADGRAHDDLPQVQALRNAAKSLKMTEFEMWWWSISGDLVYGNMLLEKVRSASGHVVELWPLRVDRTRIEPGSGTELVAAYLYRIDSREWRIPAADVLHWKWPSLVDDYWGESPLRRAFRRIVADNECTDLVKSFAQNRAVPGMALTTAEHVDPDGDEAAAAREAYYAQFGDDGRGGLWITGNTTKLEPISFNMDELAMPELMAVAEARILSVLGVPPILVGAKVGLDRSTFANYAEARLSFWQETIAWLHRRIAAKLQADEDLAPPPGMVWKWDTSEVSALEAARADERESLREDFKARLITRDEARAAMDMEPAPDGEGGFLAQAPALSLGGGGAPGDGDGATEEEQKFALERWIAAARKSPAPFTAAEVERMVARLRKTYDDGVRLSDAQVRAILRKADEDALLAESVGTTALADAALEELRDASKAYFATCAEDVRAFTRRNAVLLADNGEKSAPVWTPPNEARIDGNGLAWAKCSAVSTKAAEKLDPLLERDLETMAETWETRAAAELVPIVTSLLGKSAEVVALDLEVAFDLSNEATVSFVQEYELAFSRRVSETSREQVRTLLLKQQADGWTTERLREELEGKFETWDSVRSEQVARSETIRASNAGAKAGYVQASIEEITWLASADPCQYCASLHGTVIKTTEVFVKTGGTVDGADGGTYTNEFLAVEFPPLHPQCRCTILAGRVSL